MSQGLAVAAAATQAIRKNRGRCGVGRLWLVLLVLPWLCGCRTVELTMVGISRIKSPITFTIPKLNQPFTREDLQRVRVDPEQLQPLGPDIPPTERKGLRVDSFADLAAQPANVIVCLSGGGARATRMAAHTFDLLEQEYNRQLGDRALRQPFIRQIDAWSTVSGGSVYASYVAMTLSRPLVRTNAFEHLVTTPKVRLATQRLGAMASVFYFWPGNLGYAPLVLLMTEWDMLNLFARTHAMFQEGRFPLLPVSSLEKLGDLPAHPRFFFNATCMETGRPFVFTQSMVHRDLSGDPLARLGLDPLAEWPRSDPAGSNPTHEPLRFASTLEDLGSSPASFPLCYAVFASAAFPGLFQPLLLQKFQKLPVPRHGPRGEEHLWKKQGFVTLVDGGIYDNTGMTTALELFAHLRQARPDRRLVLLSIDADNERDAYKGPMPASKWPWRLDIPMRGLLPAVSTVSELYIKQKSLVRAALSRRVEALKQAGLLDYYEVPLVRVARNADKVRRIPTDFVLSDYEDALLKEAVASLLDEAQPGTGGKSRRQALVEAVRAAKGL